jgi:transposase
MRYGKDLRIRVLKYLSEGGSKAEAARRFCLSRTTVRVWASQPVEHEAKKPGPRTSYKFDREELIQLIQTKPDLLQKEIAQHFGVSINAISHALKCMKIRRKKHHAMRKTYSAKLNENSI